MTAEDFVSRHVLDRIPRIFRSWAAFVDWRNALAPRLEVDPTEITLVGSAAVGFSVNPNKNFQSFGRFSDIDVAVISTWHFDLGWHELRKLKGSAKLAQMSSAGREAVRAHITNHVFHGVIATDQILEHLSFARPWLEGLTYMAGVDPTSGRPINARIYRDFNALRSYQEYGIRQARNRLLERMGA